MRPPIDGTEIRRKVDEFQDQFLQQSSTVESQNSKAAIVCLVCGILSVVGFGFIGLFIVGIIAGILALSKINKSGGTLGGKGLAIAGLILNGFSVLVTIVFYIFFLSGVLFYMNSAHPGKNTGTNVVAPAR